MKTGIVIENKTGSGWSLPVVLLLVGAVAIAAAIMQLTAIADGLTSGMMPEDTRYIDHPVLPVLHLAPGILFLLLGPLQFISAYRQRWPGLHRFSGRIIILSGILVGISAIAMSVNFPAALSDMARAGNVTFGFAIIITLTIALAAILRRDVKRHRAWMIRSYVLGLTAATMRLFVLPLFFMLGEEAIVTYAAYIIWINFLFNILVAELILIRERRQQAIVVI